MGNNSSSSASSGFDAAATGDTRGLLKHLKQASERKDAQLPSHNDDDDSWTATAPPCGSPYAKIKKKASAINMVNEEGQTMLCVAALHGQARVVKLLLSLGARVDIPDDTNFTALHYAADGGHVSSVTLLLGAGADANHALLPDRWTALHLAAYHGHVPVCQLLLKDGAAVGARDGDWRTPLHLAVQGQAPNTVALLLQHGASTSVADLEGASPLQLACQVEAPADSAEAATALAIVKALVRTGCADVNHADDSSRTSLHHAAAAGMAAALGVLLEAGGECDMRDCMHQSPLFYACRHGHAAVAQRLCAAGAAVNTQDFKARDSPLMVAARAGHAACVRVLLKYGADPRPCNSAGLSAEDLVGEPNAEWQPPPLPQIGDMTTSADGNDAARHAGGASPQTRQHTAAVAAAAAAAVRPAASAAAADSSSGGAQRTDAGGKGAAAAAAAVATAAAAVAATTAAAAAAAVPPAAITHSVSCDAAAVSMLQMLRRRRAQLELEERQSGSSALNVVQAYGSLEEMAARIEKQLDGNTCSSATSAAAAGGADGAAFAFGVEP